MKFIIVMLLVLLTGCAEKEPHSLSVFAKDEECECRIDLLLQSRENVTILKAH